MLVSVKMITGFNTDVPHGDRVYHVQTEDRGRDHPVLESLVYVGGTIIARKRTPYTEQIENGATEEAIASLLRKQHQVIIAAIKAGRIEDLMKHSSGERPGFSLREKSKSTQKAAPPDAAGSVESSASLPAPEKIAKPHSGPVISTPVLPVVTAREAGSEEPGAVVASSSKAPAAKEGQPAKGQSAGGARGSGALKEKSGQKAAAQQPGSPAPARRGTGGLKKEASGNSGKIGLNLDQVISDYLKRSSEQGKLDLKVVSPSVFVAGKSITLKIQVTRGSAAEPEAIITVKVIGTAFKPQVYMGRSDNQGTTSFNLALPSFNAGTAAIVIEAQSNRGRGELKQLIRRG